MPLSSNSIIHFTKTKSALKGILKDNFHVKYCQESFSDEKPGTLAVPMVSFCDIPLSQVKNHSRSYGSYGIGMSKSWALKKGLCPAQYVAANSYYSKSQKRLIISLLPKSAKLSDLNKDEFMALDLLRYRKKYEGRLVRGSKKTENYRFYDEREWRYVPPQSEEHLPAIDGKVYEKSKGKYNSSLGGLRLKFSPKDIRYIIVKTEKEISEFVKAVREAKGKYNLNDVERLTTRIITKEQIDSDF